MADIAPSILAADFSQLKKEIEKVKDSRYLHFDIMDGSYVPNISYGPGIVQALRPYSNQIFDTHLMIVEPGKYINDFAEAGSDIITIHAEAVQHLDRVINQIKESGCQAGVALNPSTSLSVLEYVLEDLDQVLIMTVNPGFGGQKFIPQMNNKIRKLHSLINKNGLNIRLEIDGGVGIDNIRELYELGVDLFVSGSSIFKSENPAETLYKMLELIQ
ncbi:MAG: ribulose-phosphate 3-epimerase [Halanaerobiaceae bacterium]